MYFMNFHNTIPYGNQGPQPNPVNGYRKLSVEFPRYQKLMIAEGPGPKNKISESPGGGGKYFRPEYPGKFVAREGPGSGTGKYFMNEGPVAKTLRYPESPIPQPPTQPSLPSWQSPGFGNSLGNNLWNQFSNFLGGWGLGQ